MHCEMLMKCETETDFCLNAHQSPVQTQIDEERLDVRHAAWLCCVLKCYPESLTEACNKIINFFFNRYHNYKCEFLKKKHCTSCTHVHKRDGVGVI